MIWLAAYFLPSLIVWICTAVMLWRRAVLWAVPPPHYELRSSAKVGLAMGLLWPLALLFGALILSLEGYDKLVAQIPKAVEAARKRHHPAERMPKTDLRVDTPKLPQ